jgi:PAS domain S-box-containing protein
MPAWYNWAKRELSRGILELGGAPTADEAGMQQTPGTDDTLAGRKTKLLLVDDRPAQLPALRAVLADLGHDLVEARSGEEALNRLTDDDFATVLLSIPALGPDGYETARLIRSRERSRRTPILLILADEEDRPSLERAYSRGAIDHVTEPLLPGVLRAKVMGLVELFRRDTPARDVGTRAQINGTLEESEERFRQLAEAINEVFWMANPQTTEILYVSPAYERVWGRTCRSLYEEPRSFLDAVHPDDRPRVSTASLVQHAAGEATDVEYRIIRPDGSVRWVRDRGFPIKDAAGRVYRFAGIAEDITERKRAEQALRESEERFARFMQHLPGLAWIKDLQGHYVYINDAAEKAFGAPLAELLGRTDDDLFPPPTAAQFRENDRQALESGTGVQVVEILKHPDGTLHHSVASKFPVPGSDGRAALIGGMAIDISDLKRAEEALREADRKKDEFLATLAHELRNPLAPIRNTLAILKLSGVTETVAVQAREMMERQLNHLVRLVDDLMDVSRIMRGLITLKRDPVDLATVVSRAVEIAQAVIDAQGHHLTIDLPPEALRVEGDEIRLTQVVANLLNNAGKYADRPGRVWLTGRREGGDVVLRVRDQGIGIAPDVLPRVFDLFAQAARTREGTRGGLGIGLSLCKRLVEMHRGTIGAHSEGLGQGSEFVVRLPALPDITAGAAAGSAALTETGPPARRRRVLCVDDNIDACASLAMMLRLLHHDVETAHDGLAALEKAGNYRPDLILLDIGMPGLNGYEVCERLRGQLDLTDTFIVALTGWGQEEDRRRSREAGFDLHVTKPIDPQLLEDLLRRPPGRQH